MIKRLKIVFFYSFRAIVIVATSVLLFPLLYLVEPFWRFRFAIVRAERMTIISHTQLLIRKWQLYGRPPRTSWVFFAVDPCNQQLFTMLKRVLYVVENRPLNRLVHMLRPILSRTKFYEPLRNNSCHYKEMRKWDCPLYFTQEEQNFGRARLLEMGIREKDWFVCIYARSPAYLVALRGNQLVPSANAYRDCSIENFLDAARWIVAQGGFVVRIGSIIDKPLPDLGEPRIIDYSTQYRNDFLDIYLPARCRFFLGCNSGLTDLARAFNVPTAWSNLSYSSLGIGANSLSTPKLLRRKADGQFLKFSEVAALGLFPVNPDPQGEINYFRYGLDILGNRDDLEWAENDSKDILGLAMDMMDIVEGKSAPAEAIPLQRRYLAYFGQSPHNSPHAAPLGPRFAIRHRDIID